MTPTGTFLDIPTKTGFWTALAVIVVFMGLAWLAYGYAGNTFNQYVAKVGDCFIQGAIISIMPRQGDARAARPVGFRR